MVRPEMSMSTEGGMSAGLALMARVNSCWSTMPSPCWTSMGSPTRLMVTSAEMSSSRRTIWKSMWVTTFLNGWCWMSRARVKKFFPSTSRDSRVLSPASPDRAIWKSRAPTATGIGSAPWP